MHASICTCTNFNIRYARVLSRAHRMNLTKMNIAELKAELSKRGKDVQGISLLACMHARSERPLDRPFTSRAHARPLAPACMCTSTRFALYRFAGNGNTTATCSREYNRLFQAMATMWHSFK